MRFVVARRLGRRGEGLGNEMLPWAKGHLASEVLGAKLVGPSWGLNKRRYYRNFGTGRLDWLAEDLLTKLPHRNFTAADYAASGEIDFGCAVETWARERGLLSQSSFTVVVDGMYGGYPAIRLAKPFLWAKLLNSRDALRHVYEINAGLDRKKLFLAVHMRFGGDFAQLAEGEDARGKFNIFTPGEWYMAVCGALQESFGDQIEFRFFTDRGGPDFDRAVARFNPGQVRQGGLTECSDLLLLAMADLRVCSISSYSLVASFLSGGPYVWYEPQLNLHDSVYTLWGHEADQMLAGSLTMSAVEHAKRMQPSGVAEGAVQGFPVGMEGRLPEALIAQLQQKLLAKERATNLLEYGAVPTWIAGR